MGNGVCKTKYWKPVDLKSRKCIETSNSNPCPKLDYKDYNWEFENWVSISTGNQYNFHG